MNAAKPIIPPESPLHRTHAAAGPKLFVSIFAILTVHAFLLAGLLIQGCKREDGAGSQETAANPVWNQPVPAPSSSAPPAAPASAAGQTNPIVIPAPFVTPPATNVAVASRERASTPPALTAPNAESDQPMTIYVVKQGDNLTAIARAHGTTVKAIRAVNNLKTDRLLVGKKLKIPGTSPSMEAKATTPASTNLPSVTLPR